MADAIKATDNAVSAFTKSILGIARKNGVDFSYVGPKHSAAEEIIKVMRVNNKVVTDLLKKK